MPDFLDVDLYYGLVAGGAFIWLFRGWVEKRKAEAEKVIAKGVRKAKDKF